jgi:hypothetical protein
MQIANKVGFQQQQQKFSLESSSFILMSSISNLELLFEIFCHVLCSKSNISIIQRSQSKILRTIPDAPWNVPNITLHEDLNVPLVNEIIKQRSTIYHNKIEGHVNVLIQPLLQPHNERRLKRNWPADPRKG